MVLFLWRNRLIWEGLGGPVSYSTYVHALLWLPCDTYMSPTLLSWVPLFPRPPPEYGVCCIFSTSVRAGPVHKQVILTCAVTLSRLSVPCSHIFCYLDNAPCPKHHPAVLTCASSFRAVSIGLMSSPQALEHISKGSRCF